MYLTLCFTLILCFIVTIQTNSFRGIELPRRPIRIEAHRGAGHLDAENTLQAFELAIELGLDGIETDVWLTKDHVPILVHGTLEPQRGFIMLKGGHKNISMIESAHLKGYTLKNGEKIVTLAEGLEACKDRISLNLELKDWREEVVGRVLDLVEEKGMMGQVSLSSFYHNLRERLTMETARRKIAAINFGYLSYVGNLRFPDYSSALLGDTINIDITYIERYPKESLNQIQQAKKHGVLVKVWFPMTYKNEALYYKKLIEIGVDTIITNDPALALEYFGNELFMVGSIM